MTDAGFLHVEQRAEQIGAELLQLVLLKWTPIGQTVGQCLASSLQL